MRAVPKNSVRPSGRARLRFGGGRGHRGAIDDGSNGGRSAGVRYVVATQSLSNLTTAGGDKLLHAAIDNAELLIIHRQAVPDAAETLASIGGTEESWEHTHMVDDAAGWRIGADEPGRRSRRLTDRFRAHPNVIKQLRQGEAVLVSQRPTFAVRRVRVRGGVSARRRTPERSGGPLCRRETNASTATSRAD